MLRWVLGGAGGLARAEGFLFAGPGEGVGIVAGERVEVAEGCPEAVEIDKRAAVAFGDAFGEEAPELLDLLGHDGGVVLANAAATESGSVIASPAVL